MADDKSDLNKKDEHQEKLRKLKKVLARGGMAQITQMSEDLGLYNYDPDPDGKEAELRSK